jgi:hypothetical protein
MAAHVVGLGRSYRDMGLAGGFRIGKQILDALFERAAAAVERSRFAALPPRYLEDAGMTEADRAAALGFEEPRIDGWRVVASHL